MEIEGWKYYNHAMVSTSGLDEPVNLEPIKNREIWHVRGGIRSLLVGFRNLTAEMKQNGGIA